MGIEFGFGKNAVNPAGVILMIAALFIVFFAGKIARHFKKDDGPMMVNFIKLAGMILCMAGALIAILC